MKCDYEGIGVASATKAIFTEIYENINDTMRL